MKAGAENRKKTIAAGALVAVALCCIFYAYNALFGGTSAAPPPTVAPITRPAPATNAAPAQTAATTAANAGRSASIAGVDAAKLAHTSASLDPTLDETAMHRAESLVYSGIGRNIFSLTYTPPPVTLPKNVPPPRPRPVPLPPAPPPGPPPPPPINLKFFGTARRSNGLVQAFLLQGDNVYLASAGEIVAHKYKIVSINLNSIQVEDLQNNNTQTLPLQMQ
ncbi:MAG TPA: hypothetical protein VFA99_02550 [Acidobacteriaceae bacterium]|nr:hypothetical protein [Acidobacteriaceae bacterium]